MLQKAMYERHDLKRHGAPTAAFLLFVLEKHLPVFDLDDATVGDGHPEDIRGQIFYGLCPGADHPTVHHPGLLPGIGADAGSKPALFHGMEKFCLKDL